MNEAEIRAQSIAKFFYAAVGRARGGLPANWSEVSFRTQEVWTIAASELLEELEANSLPSLANFSVEEMQEEIDSRETPADVSLLDCTIRQLSEQCGMVSGTTGSSGVAFAVATGEDAMILSKWINRKGRA